MCGIAGIVSLDSKSVEFEYIKRLTARARHRGLDGDGYFVEDGVGFGHRRLSILDLSKNGAQPMSYLDRYVLVHNGEIYNYIELKLELSGKGYRFSSNSDSEVVLAAYDCWGAEAVNKFEGMWAFAIYDRMKMQVFLSRDRFGIKPLYYMEQDRLFFFASEPKQLVPELRSRAVNGDVLRSYLLIGMEDFSRETFFQGIFSLDPGSNLTINLETGVRQTNVYYSVSDIPRQDSINRSLQEYCDEFRELLSNSIELRLRSDVQVGTCLSGGLDSSSIAAIASRKYVGDAEFIGIHARPFDHARDESRFAKMAAEGLRLKLAIIEPTESEYHDEIDRIIFQQDEPFGTPSVVMQDFVMRRARELGCKVMLDGQAGDELLLGYQRYFPSYLSSLNFLKATIAAFQVKFNADIGLMRLLLYRLYFTNPRWRLMRLKQYRRYFQDGYIEKIDKNLLRQWTQSFKDVNELQRSEVGYFQLSHLLRYEDRSSMRHGVEARLPFLDHKLVEFSLKLPNSLKIRSGWSKYILRKAMVSELPAEILWRRNKFGFEPPLSIFSDEQNFAETLRKSSILKEIVDIEQVIARPRTSSGISDWRFFNIAKWEAAFGMSNIVETNDFISRAA